MKVLFVCGSNIGRSQMAEAFFNEFSKRNSALSAGTDTVGFQGKTIEEAGGRNVIGCMLEDGMDVSNKRIKRFNKKLFDSADRVVSMVGRENMPGYARDSEKVLYWNVPDPRYEGFAFHQKTRDRIKRLVKNLVKEIE